MTDRSRIHSLVDTDAVQRVVGDLDGLPPCPRVYRTLVAAAADPSISIVELSRVIESDPGLGSKVLHLVNSAFFGVTRRTTSIQQALGYLGLEVLKGLILTAHVFDAAATKPIAQFSLDAFQAYSLRVATLAREIVTTAERRDEAFTAGLLHDVGKLVLSITQPGPFGEILARVGETLEEQHVVETELLGVSHAEAGAYLLWSWGLPMPIIEAVAFHHMPRRVIAEHPDVVAAVHTADALVGIIDCNEPESRIDAVYLESAGMLAELPRWRRLAGDA